MSFIVAEIKTPLYRGARRRGDEMTKSVDVLTLPSVVFQFFPNICPGGRRLNLAAVFLTPQYTIWHGVGAPNTASRLCTEVCLFYTTLTRLTLLVWTETKSQKILPTTIQAVGVTSQR